MARSVVPFWENESGLRVGMVYQKTLVDNRFAVYTFLTKEKRGSVSDNYDLGTIKYHTLAILS